MGYSLISQKYLLFPVIRCSVKSYSPDKYQRQKCQYKRCRIPQDCSVIPCFYRPRCIRWCRSRRSRSNIRMFKPDTTVLHSCFIQYDYLRSQTIVCIFHINFHCIHSFVIYVIFFFLRRLQFYTIAVNSSIGPIS